jgi:hypothetical protein
MLIIIIAALQSGVMAGAPVPPAPPPHLPFTHRVQIAAQKLGERVGAEYKRCGDARAYSNKFGVEAFGTARFSTEWKKATEALKQALTVCRDQQRALRHQDEFLIEVAQHGTKYDADLASIRLRAVSLELHAIEQYFSSEIPRYRKLITDGWGDPHCLEHADGYMLASSLCPPTADKSRP